MILRRSIGRSFAVIFVLTLAFVTLGTGAFGQGVEKKAPPLRVAILLYDGVQIIDFSGPWEVFGHAGYTVFTVAEKTGPVTTTFNETVIASHNLEDAPPADILLIPGGDVGDELLSHEALIRWIRRYAESSPHVLTVCTGAFLAGKSGILDGLTVTTFHGALTELARATPKAIVVGGRRYVDNGKIITTGGLSAGIDGALHLVSTLSGEAVARRAATVMEYVWQPSEGGGSP